MIGNKLSTDNGLKMQFINYIEGTEKEKDKRKKIKAFFIHKNTVIRIRE